jgi:hypothetical protein
MVIDIEYQWYMDMVIHHIHMVCMNIEMGYGLILWEMTVSIWSSGILISDILSLWLIGGADVGGGSRHEMLDSSSAISLFHRLKSILTQLWCIRLLIFCTVTPARAATLGRGC